VYAAPMRAHQLLTAAVVALLVPGCFLDRSALDGPGADGGQPPDIDAAGVDAFVPRIDAGPNDGGPVCAPTSAVDLCGGGDDDCNPATPDGSGEATFGEPCDGADMGACTEGTMVCDGTGLRCNDLTEDDVEICNGLDDDCDGEIDQGDVCPCTHDTFGDHSYLFCATGAGWQAASKACPGGYELVRIDSLEEHVFVVGVATGVAPGTWWFGGSGGSDGMWRWLVGDDLIPRTGQPGFSNWAGGEPNSTTECLEMRTDQSGAAGVAGEWNDAGCGGSKPYICESRPAP